ncbi:MAG: hypothetical protein AABW51_02915 [Nanoarchaeota archaeon]
MTKRRTAGFESREQEGAYHEFIGKYVTIYTSNSNFSGRLTGIEDDRLVLNPHVNGHWDSKIGLVRKLVHGNTKIRIDADIVIEPATKESLANFCTYQNKENLKKQTANNTKAADKQ